MPTRSTYKAPLALALVSAALLGCSSSYEPEGQFWPNLGSIGSGGEASGGSNGTAGAPANLAGASNAGAPQVLPGAGGSDPVAGMGGSDSSRGGASSAGAANGGRSGQGGTFAAGGSAGARTGSAGSSSGGAANAGAGGTSSASSTCSLSVSVTTTAPGGNYKPRNVGAIWIADSAGKFVKSLEVWGNQRLSHVTAWNAATRAAGVSGNKVDAITSATLSAHRTHNVSWNCTNYNRQVVPDGMYRVYFEITDANSSGPNHFENFAKGTAPVSVQSSSTNFNNISLMFKP